MTAALPDLSFHPAWHAQLELAYARAGDATRPVTRRHAGPLRVQKHLYAEGPEVCQHILVHPPGGIAGGDSLAFDVRLGERAWAQLTSPGAAVVPRRLPVAADPGDPPGARRHPGMAAAGKHRLRRRPGRTGNPYPAARRRPPVLLGHGRARPPGQRRALRQRPLRRGPGHPSRRPPALARAPAHRRRRPPARLADRPRRHPVLATLVASGEIDTDLLQRCRALPCAGRGNLSQLPGGLLAARCLADEALHARAWLIELWRLLRPALLGREAVPHASGVPEMDLSPARKTSC